MRLRPRVIVWFGVATVVVAAGLPLLTSHLLLRSYVDLERQSTREDMLRVREAFQQVGGDLHLKSIDWAEWDDTYRFVADRDDAYVRSNMVPASLATMKVDLMMIIDLHGHPIYSLPIRRTRGVPPPDPRRVMRALTANPMSASLFRARDGFHGIIRQTGQPLMISVRPIVPSHGDRPPRGWFLFGRYFGANEVAELVTRTRLDVRFFDAASTHLPPECLAALNSVSPAGSVDVRPLNEHTIAGATNIADIFGRPLLLMRISGARSIYRRGVESAWLIAPLIAIAAILFASLALLVLEQFVLSRITTLTTQVQKIGTHGNSNARVVLHGRDELSSLAATINDMLRTLAESTTRIRKADEERRKQIEHQAFHDPLTGLPNRALFMERLSHGLARANRSGRDVAVLFLDLDNFKVTNDTQGHDAGDALLKLVAERLLQCVRPGDTVARFAGDEFTILLEQLSGEKEAVPVAERIVEAMKEPVQLNQGEVYPAASVGIAVANPRLGDEAPETVLRNSDTAMYYAKMAGKGTFAVFEAGMDLNASQRLEIENGLRTALDNEELRIHYQPLICLRTGQMTGVEALVRWQHPTRGLVPPSQFIPIAEETGLIVPIGFWILETACRQVKQWYELFPDRVPLTLNVNLSRRQIEGLDLPERVADALVSTGFPASSLKLEITESVLVTDMDDAKGQLGHVKRLGVKLAIDDFGTGYSSMSSLSAFPVDSVKIDRSFVERIAQSEDASAIVAAIVKLCQTMRMDVTAEGIESIDQVAVLQATGCDTGQGYLFAKPMTAPDLEQRLRDGWRADIEAPPAALIQSRKAA